MKRYWNLLVAVVLSLAAVQALAHEGHGEKKKPATAASAAAAEQTPKSVTGEVVDTGCYLAHEGRGPKHVSCATKCILGGMPMGLLTSEGTLYLLTMNHDNADPYNALKEMAGKTVTVTGAVMERGGMKGIDVTAYSLVTEPAKK